MKTNGACCMISEPVLGEGLLMMLLDLTASMSGPRLRDKLSHGECDLANVPGWFANHVLALALAVTHHKVQYFLLQLLTANNT